MNSKNIKSSDIFKNQVVLPKKSTIELEEEKIYEFQKVLSEAWPTENRHQIE